MSDWECVYEKAIRDDGSLFFPERLSQSFLDEARRTQGSYIFANQYQNEVIPDDSKTFKKSWFRYYNNVNLPRRIHTFAFIDPAISEADTADYTGAVVVSVDCAQNWYIRYAKRQRLNPSALIDLCFDLCDKFGVALMGIEDVAFQRAVVHFAHEEMKRRGRQIPLMGVKRGTDKTKETRILGLVPRLEWGSVFFQEDMIELESELLSFPRGKNDDLIDAMSSLDLLIHYPQPERSSNEPPAPSDPRYESYFIQNAYKRTGGGQNSESE